MFKLRQSEYICLAIQERTNQMTDANGEKVVPAYNRWRRIQISAVVLVVVFLLGLVPM